MTLLLHRTPLQGKPPSRQWLSGALLLAVSVGTPPEAQGSSEWVTAAGEILGAVASAKVPPLNSSSSTSSDPLYPRRSSTQVGVSASGLHVFGTADHLHGHTGWGGVIELSGLVFKPGIDGWHGIGSVNFTYFETSADFTRDGAVYNEDVEAYQLHFNAGLGYRVHDFDFGAWFGAGLGAMHTRNTLYNTEGSNTSLDAVFQLGARVTWQPTDSLSIFAGYRMLWNVPFESGTCGCGHYYDDPLYPYWNDCGRNCGCRDNDDGPKEPRMLAHAFEVGIRFTF